MQVICPEVTETDTPRYLDRAAHQLPKQDTSIECVAKKRLSPIAGRHMREDSYAPFTSLADVGSSKGKSDGTWLHGVRVGPGVFQNVVVPS